MGVERSMPEGGRPLVGVVDDDMAVRDSLRFLLEAAGFRAVTFPSVEQYLTAPGQEEFTCLLLDQHMPSVTGLDLLQRLRAMGDETPVALMTGSPSAQLTRRAEELGAVAVLEKPLTEGRLFQFIEDATGWPRS